jgi:acetyltransferase-like isoleucine patch superfamily enzyme
MKTDLRPYFIKKNYLRFRHWYTEYFLRPEFASLGDHHTFMKPWHTVVSGPNIHLGHSATVVSEPDNNVRLGVWGRGPGLGSLRIGDAAMISPGVRITASDEITIGDGCMMAHGAYITDCDWHGIYDRVNRDPDPKPVHIGHNVWIGDHATVLKGVTIGDNSIVAAGCVVTKDIPANVIVAGNPARIVKELDPTKTFHTRTQFYANPAALAKQFDDIDRMVLTGNSFWCWVRSILLRR